MNTSYISFKTQASHDAPEIQLVFWFDGVQVQDWPLTQELREFRHEFPDQDDQEHCLEIELRGKEPRHTLIDEHGTILSDVVAEIHSIALDDIELGHVFVEQATYYHDHNGTTEPLHDQFFGAMGCNGRVTLKFHSPVYLWLLENL